MRAAMGDGANVHDDDDDDDDDAGKDTVWISGHARMGDRGRRRSVFGVRRSVVTPDARADGVVTGRRRRHRIVTDRRRRRRRRRRRARLDALDQGRDRRGCRCACVKGKMSLWGKTDVLCVF